MNEDQKEKIKKLSLCTFLPGSWDKRFVKYLNSIPEDFELSDNRNKWLNKLFYKYRKQISALRYMR